MSTKSSPRKRATARQIDARKADAEAAIGRLRQRAAGLEARLREVNPLWLVAGGTVAGALAARFVAPHARGALARAGLLSAGMTAMLPSGLALLENWLQRSRGPSADETGHDGADSADSDAASARSGGAG